MSQQRTAYSSPSVTPSLRVFFGWFLDDDLEGGRRKYLTPLTLRLLLHPINSLVHNLRQLLGCFDEGSTPRSFSPITKKTTEAEMEKMQALLRRWHGLYQILRYEVTVVDDHTRDLSLLAGLLTYHVIGLNTVSSVIDIENVARQRLSDARLRRLSPNISGRCIQDTEQSLFHAGQIIYLLRTLKKKARPPWWPAALYRATLVIWAASLFKGMLWKKTSLQRCWVIDAEQTDEAFGPAARTDVVLDESCRYRDVICLDSRPTTPLLSGLGDNSGPVALNDPIVSLETCILAFGREVTTRFSEGVCGKLEQLLQRRCDVCKD